MSHTKTFKITSTCFDHQIFAISFDLILDKIPYPHVKLTETKERYIIVNNKNESNIPVKEVTEKVNAANLSL
jgi:hypothetical protein